MSLTLKKLRRDGDSRYAQRAYEYAKSCANEASSLSSFVKLFNHKIASFKTSLPTKLKDVYHASLDPGKAVVKKKISENNYAEMYLIEGGAS